MEHYEKVIFVSSACFEVDYVHDSVCLLEQVESALVLLSLNEPVGTVVELGHHNRNLILRDAEFFVVMLVECVIFLQSRSSSSGFLSHRWALVRFLDR